MPSVSRLYTAVGVTTPLVGFSLSAVTCNASISISRSSLTVSAVRRAFGVERDDGHRQGEHAYLHHFAE